MSADDTARVPVTVRASFDGWPVDLDLTIAPARLGAALQRLAELGYTPRAEASPATPQGPRKAPAARKVEPLYTPAGAPCCPVHKRELAEGRYGLYCPARAGAGEDANDKGYCALRFDA